MYIQPSPYLLTKKNAIMKLILPRKPVLACLLFGLALASCKKDQTSSTLHEPSLSRNDPGAATAALTYQLVWSDEFNGTSVNTSNWNFETGAGGWGNNEKQYYRSQNATVSNGTLVITAKKESFGGAQYTSARMTSQNKRTFTYGRMEARIKLPMGQGLWPAFWMLGSSISSVGWPKCGETDIMEHINTENKVYGTIHWDNNGYASYGGNTTTTPDSYHVYSIEWTSSSIKWFVDGVKYHEANILNSINGTDEFHKPFFFILNLAVGGNWPGQTIDNTKLPASMFVDYVRVYQLL
jgi:beta-glucanase (GH16 family)